MKKKFISFCQSFIIFILAIISISCVAEIDPLTGKKTYTLLSTEQEIKIGHSVIPSAINENEGLYPDKEVQNYVRDLGRRIASVTPRDVDYQFYVVNSSQINAFALPGGPVFITRGILLKMEKENELVGVLAHELGHINARHHAKFLEKTYGMSMLIGILSIAVHDSRYASAIVDLAQISAGLLQLKFSRDQENEADGLGVRFSYQAGYNPKGLLTMFQKFKSLEKRNTVEWLSTHPLPDTRIRNVEYLIATQYPQADRLKQDSSSFQRIKNILIASKHSYEQIERAKKYINSRNYHEAISILSKAIDEYPSNLAYTYRAFANLKLKRYQEALKDSDKAIELDSLYFQPRLIKGIALNQMERWRDSINVLESAKKLITDNPDLYYYLGVDYQAVGDRKRAIDSLTTALNLTDGKRGWEGDAQRRLRILRGY